MPKPSDDSAAIPEIPPAEGDTAAPMLPRFGGEYEDQTVALTDDAKAKAIHALQTGTMGFKFLLERVASGEPVDKSLAYSVLSSHESYVAELATLIGVEVDSKKAREERYAALRTANQRVHFLEGQLGASVTSAHVSAGLKSLAKKIQTWWERDGFGFATDISFGAYGTLEAKLCFSPFLRSSAIFRGSRSSDEAVRAEWLRKKQEQGFEFIEVPGEKGPHLAATAANQACLFKFLADEMPSAMLGSISLSIEGRDARPEDMKGVLHEAKLHVRNLSDVASLPDIPEED